MKMKWLINNRHLLLTVLEAGILKSGCQHGHMRALFPAADFLWILTMEGSSVGSPRRILLLFMKAPPSWTKHLLKPSSLCTIIFDVIISMFNIWGDKNTHIKASIIKIISPLGNTSGRLPKLRIPPVRMSPCLLLPCRNCLLAKRCKMTILWLLLLLWIINCHSPWLRNLVSSADIHETGRLMY